MTRRLAWTGIAVLTAMAAASIATNGKPAALGTTPVPIPPGYGFPTPNATIEQWIATSDTGAMRGHAWELWAGMTAPSGQGTLPVWDTWGGKADLKGPPPSAVALTAIPRAAAGHAFETPIQFTHRARRLHLKAMLGTSVTAAQTPIEAERFDPTDVAFVRSPHPGPDGKTYFYNSATSLNALNSAWPTNTPVQNRAIVDFPNTAMETKPVYNLVKATGLPPLPVWQGGAGATNQTNPTEDTWTNCLLIDPKGAGAVQPATPAQIKSVPAARLTGLACKTFFYGPLSLIYAQKLSAGDAARFGHGAAAGDFAVLVAMHVNTKETTLWTWQTFYWEPLPDPAGQNPGSKDNQPTSLPAPWKTYSMCANYDQTTTSGGTTMDVCYNPYLETSPGIPAGVTSNCMSCHGVATVNSFGGYPTQYTKPVIYFTDPSYYNATTTRTDFSWTVADF